MGVEGDQRLSPTATHYSTSGLPEYVWSTGLSGHAGVVGHVYRSGHVCRRSWSCHDTYTQTCLSQTLISHINTPRTQEIVLLEVLFVQSETHTAKGKGRPFFVACWECGDA